MGNLITVTGAQLKATTPDHRYDLMRRSTALILGREVEQGKNYNTPHYAGTTNAEQTFSAADHTHGTPDGTIALLAASIVASVRGADPALYIPEGWENHPPMIRGSLSKWRLFCYPPDAQMSFHIHFPGFIDGRRTVMPHDFDIPGATNGSSGDIAGGEVRSSALWELIGIGSGQNITDDSEADVTVTHNGSNSPDPITGNQHRAQGCTLNLHGHRNRTWAFVLLPQLDPNGPEDEDLPEE